MKSREHKPESPHILHTTKDKHQLTRAVESNKHGGSRNGVKARKKQIQTEWSMQRARAPHTCTQPIHRKWATGQGFQRVWFGNGEKNLVYSRVLAKASLGEMSCWDEISPKRGKYGLGPFNA